jgi:viroplasmin and RNaseH domain-containing protein
MAATILGRLDEKYYVVLRRRRPGVYSSWIDTYAQVDEYHNGAYVVFYNQQDANEAWAWYERIFNPRDLHSCSPTTLQDSKARAFSLMNTMVLWFHACYGFKQELLV